jgi:hypothetical protein
VVQTIGILTAECDSAGVNAFIPAAGHLGIALGD